MNPQVVPLQVAVPFVGAVHTVQLGPHAPTPSVTHEPPQDSVPAGHWHTLLTHCFPPVHGLPQPPQLLLSLVSSTHAAPQGEYPELHATLHALATHVACAWATLVVQTLPHVLQLPALLVVSTHEPLHSVGVPAGQPDAH